MDVDLTAEQRQLRDTVRKFAQDEIAPHSRAWDEAAAFPSELFRKLGELGILGIFFPELYGGAGMGYMEYAIAVEELARVDPAVTLSIVAHISLCSNHIFHSGTEDQRRKFLPGLISGHRIGCWSLTEPDAGSDAAAMRTRAERGDNGWLLNGAKIFTTNGSTADVCVAMAVTDLERKRRGISAFIVEKGTGGFRSGKREKKMGMCASDTSEMLFEDCLVPRENLLGLEGQGLADCLQVLDGGRISIAALSVGVAQGAFELGLRYARERRQFGKTIAEFQGTKWKIADMATQIEAARLLTHRACMLRDGGLPFAKEASMAKLHASETAVRVTGEALQLHGGYGYLKDYPIEKFYRDAKLCTIGEGTSEIQKLVIAKHILGSSD